MHWRHIFATGVIATLSAACTTCTRQSASSSSEATGSAGVPRGNSSGATSSGGAGSDAAPAVIPYGTPDEWILYDLGEGPRSQPFDIHVDADGIYWAQKAGRLMRGSLDGKDPPVQVGEWGGTLGGRPMITDATHIYWEDIGILHRANKRDGSGAEQVSMPWDHGGSYFATDDEYVYFPMPGCAAINRIDKATLEVETIYIDGIEPGVGRAFINVYGGELYCGSWGNIFWIPAWGEPARLLHSTSKVVAGPLLVGDSIYWLQSAHEFGGGIARVPRHGGQITLFEYPQAATGFGRQLVYVSPQGSFYFLNGAAVGSFSLASHRWSLYHRDYRGGPYLVMHDKYLYWARADLHIPGSGAIIRMPLDTEPLFVYDEPGRTLSLPAPTSAAAPDGG